MQMTDTDFTEYGISFLVQKIKVYSACGPYHISQLHLRELRYLLWKIVVLENNDTEGGTQRLLATVVFERYKLPQ